MPAGTIAVRQPAYSKICEHPIGIVKKYTMPRLFHYQVLKIHSSIKRSDRYWFAIYSQ